MIPFDQVSGPRTHLICKEAMAGSFPVWICGWFRDAASGASGAGC